LLVGRGVTEFIVSIHGHLSRVHDALTRTKGSFAQTVAGLENVTALARARPLRVVAAVTLNQRNLRYFGELLEFTQGFDVSETVFNVVQPVQVNMARHFDKLMPRYSEVAATIEAYYSQQPQRFRSERTPFPKRIVSIIDLPACQTSVLREYLGLGESRIVEDVVYTEAVPRGARKRRLMLDNRGEKEKRPECASCRFDRRCSGIYSMYVERWGWDEFEPVVE
jgi:cyclic pyranopterin phosphate synthase